MAMDSYSQALAARRGKGIDSSLMAPVHGQVDTEVGMAGGSAPNLPVAPAHTPPVGEQHAALMPGHVPPVGEASRGAPMPLAQSTGMGGGDLVGQVGDHVGGHASQDEYEMLKGMPANTLGSKAKMGALKSKYEPAGK